MLFCIQRNNWWSVESVSNVFHYASSPTQMKKPTQSIHDDIHPMSITMGHLNTLPLAYTDVYIHDFIRVAQAPLYLCFLNHILHSIHQLFQDPPLSVRCQGVSVSNLSNGDTAIYNTLDIFIHSLCSSDIIALLCTKVVSDMIQPMGHRCSGQMLLWLLNPPVAPFVAQILQSSPLSLTNCSRA
jgi:hypothetical protein